MLQFHRKTISFTSKWGVEEMKKLTFGAVFRSGGDFELHVLLAFVHGVLVEQFTQLLSRGVGGLEGRVSPHLARRSLLTKLLTLCRS